MLEIENIIVRLGGNMILQDVTAHFAPGTLHVLIGPNGSGKTTLLKTIAGLLPAASGSVTVDGQEVATLSPKARAKKIAYLPQFRNVPDITAGRLALHGRFPHLSFPRTPTAEDRQIAADALREVGARELAAKSLKELSGGQRQKVYLAMALAQQAEIILLDEPTTYLDISHQLQVMELAKKLAAQGRTVIMVLHDLPLAFPYADHLFVMEKGKIVRDGAPEKVYDSDVIENVFGVRLSDGVFSYVYRA